MTYETNTQDKDPDATVVAPMTDQEMGAAMCAMAKAEKARHEKWLGAGQRNTEAATRAVKVEHTGVLKAITASKDGIGIAGVMSEAGITHGAARNALAKLLTRGQIRNTVKQKGVTAKYVAVQ